MPSKTQGQRFHYDFRTAIKPCKTCKEPVRLINTRDLERKKFCSDKCKWAALDCSHLHGIKYSERQCKECGVDYIPNVNKQAYCSTKCCAKVLARRSVLRHNDLISHIKRLLIYKSRKHLNLECINIIYEKQNGLCALSGIPMTWNRLNGRVNTNLSIDRINSSLPYNEDNIQLVCRIVNIMKNNLGQLEFRELCRKIGGYSNSK